MPLPGFILMKMPFKLSQIVSLSSSVDGMGLMSDFSDLSDDYFPYFGKKRVDKWIATVIARSWVLLHTV